jgi:multidrug efflux pump subunit AcrA (membrane-fusion protein)
VSGDGFAKTVLNGVVAYTEQQAANGDSGGTPSFLAHIIVRQITNAQRKQIHIGMSAQVKLQITRPPTIIIPIDAVYTEKGQTMVKIIDKKTKKTQAIPVDTGPTTANGVEILQGLKSGDEVIIDAGT